MPLPEVKSFAELNAYLYQCCLADDSRQVSGQTAPIGEMWQTEKEQLRPLPTHPYACCRIVNVRLNRYSQVQVDTNLYSVPTDKESLVWS
ncbi:MAG: hypothetical protein M5U34_04425 [Chloroflexi bacterium]|nr:hypothetical protein [Chloroflexota bacterium]